MRWLKVLAGCGCLTVVGIALSCLLIYRQGNWADLFGKAFIVDHDKVAALTRSICPGAQVPQGFVGIFGSDSGLGKLAIMGPDTGDPTRCTLTLLAFPPSNQTRIKTREEFEIDMRNAVEHQDPQKHQQEKVVSQQVEPVKVGDQEIPAGRCVREGPQGRTEELLLIARHPSQDRVVGVFVEGPEKEYPKAAEEEFLSKLQVRPLTQEASATPAPEATGTPEATSGTTNASPTPGSSE